MHYVNLNLENRYRMNGICNNDYQMEWEDSEFMEILLGKLPEVRRYQNETEFSKEIIELKEMYNKYDYMKTNKQDFLEKLKVKVDNIQKKNKYWNGLNVWYVQECLERQKFCLVSGNGGIGKSFFVKCLEERLDEENIEHLCIYGKFEKDISRIPFGDIEKLAENKRFVFVIDALNEMEQKAQRELYSILMNVKKLKGLQVVITYRSHTLENDILMQYEELAESIYSFPGVSFESALDCLIKASVADIYKYEDVLYSNNALLLSKLCKILDEPKVEQELLNSVSSLTFILEHYIKKTLDFPTWQDTKKIAGWMYHNNEKTIDRQSLENIIENPTEYIQKMEQQGFINSYVAHDKEKYLFSIDSLTDFLIARYLWDDLRGKDTNTQITIIQDKLNNLYGIEEAIILALFDNFSPNYAYIKEVLVKTKLINELSYETLVKINFKKENISAFLKEFCLNNESELILYFGGYTDKPFNCTNYLNNYYFGDEKHQLNELSKVLSGKYFLGRVKGRLKNILYFMNVNDGENRRVEEAFYFALWCCAAANQDVRCLAMKVLYEVINQNAEYKQITVDAFSKIKDIYILDAIIYVLANCDEGRTDCVKSFFKQVIANEDFTLAKSLKRISVSLNDSYGYIKWNKKNFYRDFCDEEISEEFSRLLNIIDLHDKSVLPFRYWGKDHIDMHAEFLSVPAEQIIAWNNMLAEKFECVKQNGECNGYMGFERKVAELFSTNYMDNVLDRTSFFLSFEYVVKKIFNIYGLSYDIEDGDIYGGDEFSDSLLLKCVCIAQDIFYGSLMCNYFTNEFGTYNNIQHNVGYEVYDPIEYGEEIYISSPIPTYHSTIEKLGDMVVKQIEIPETKDELWARNIGVTEKNILSLTKSIEMKGCEWIMLAGRISIHERKKDELQWKDTYDYWCCTSNDVEINGEREDRYLTIELENYDGNINLYAECLDKPWLCKNVHDIKYSSGIFDETSLVLPPAEIIRQLKLKPCYKDMSWLDEDEKVAIYCNNVKNSYYRDFIGGTVFIRKDALDKFLESNTIKFFAFTERWTHSTGYADETAIHFEIQKGEILKKYYNCAERNTCDNEMKFDCSNCEYGFNERDYNTNALRELLSEIGIESVDDLWSE